MADAATYARMHRKYLQTQHPKVFQEYQKTGELTAHVMFVGSNVLVVGQSSGNFGENQPHVLCWPTDQQYGLWQLMAPIKEHGNFWGQKISSKA